MEKKKLYYVAGAVVGLLVYLWYRNYKNAAASNAAQNATVPVSAFAPGNSTTSLAPTPGSSNPIQTLSDWINAAQHYATNSLNADPALVQNALLAYTQGSCLTQQEYNIVDSALGSIGSPPDAPISGVQLCANSSGTTSSSPAPTPPPTSSSPAPTNDVQLQNDLETQINQMVGTLSNITHRGSTPDQVQQWANQAGGSSDPFAGLGSIGQQFWIQSQNVGNITSQIHTSVNPSDIGSLARQLASQRGYNFDQLNGFEQNQFMQLANVQLATQQAAGKQPVHA